MKTYNLEKIGLRGVYSKNTLEEVTQPSAIKTHLEEFAKKPEGTLVLTGPNGTGKTFALSATVQKYFQNGNYDARYFDAFELYEKYLEALQQFRSPDGLLKQINSYELFALDDLGVNRSVTDAYLLFLWKIISDRNRDGLGTLITTNLDRESMRKILGEAITSRLGEGVIIRMFGKDRREEKQVLV